MEDAQRGPLFEMPSSRSGSSTEDNCSGSTHRERISCGLVTAKEETELLESAKAEIGEAREENERLKWKLELMEKNYQNLQVRFFDILRSTESSSSIDVEDTKESGLVSLHLGMSPFDSEMDNNKKEKETIVKKLAEEDEEGLLDTKLKLSAKVKTSSTTSEEPKFDEEETIWPPKKMQKTTGENGEDGASPQTQAKRTRVSVRARCDSPTMNDGCQWRKYGQKISKGNPCPRAYYRCTVAPGCPVRKQVQRCFDDMLILITTYEGTHNHPLSVSATAMASTTSAAASMLLSGSSTSVHPSINTPNTIVSGFNGLNFSIYDNSRNRFYLPNTPSPLHPTITLDLTTPQMPGRFSSNFTTRPAGFPPLNSLNFSASEQSILPPPWSSYGAGQNPSIQSYVAASSQQSLTETLTKALTTDPSFQSVIAAALSSMVAANKPQVGPRGSSPLLRPQFPFSADEK